MTCSAYAQGRLQVARQHCIEGWQTRSKGASASAFLRPPCSSGVSYTPCKRDISSFKTTAEALRSVVHLALLSTPVEKDMRSRTWTESKDRYGGVIVELPKYLDDGFDDQTTFPLTHFKADLDDHMKKWHERGIRGVWLNIHVSSAGIVPQLAEVGFRLHHARGQSIMMNAWLPRDEPNMLPQWATHQLGVGGVVFNEENKVLVVTERYAHMQNYWKLPGGAVDMEEELPDAVRREVKEETGVDAEFVSLAGFRHLLQFAFGMGDVYFVCFMRATPGSTIRTDPREISAAKWMDLEEFLALEHYQHFVGPLADALRRFARGEMVGFRPERISMNVRRMSSYLYHAH